MGRDRKLVPETDAEIIALGEELLEWASTPEDAANGIKKTTWSFWYAIEKDMVLKEWKALLKMDIFRPYYEKARAYLARNLHNNSLEKGLAHRYIRYYDLFLAENEDEDKANDIALKMNAARSVGEQARTGLEMLLSDQTQALKNASRDL